MTRDTTQDGDVGFIRALAELLRSNDLTEIQVKRDYGEADSLNVRVSRGPLGPAFAPALPPAAPPALAPPSLATAAATPPSAAEPGPLAGAVTSPMVGTVYLQAEPGTPPFAPVGQAVKEGDTLLIIEAMKTMNQIPAPHAGVVRRVLVEDGAPVEYGAPLLVIE